MGLGFTCQAHVVKSDRVDGLCRWAKEEEKVEGKKKRKERGGGAWAWSGNGRPKGGRRETGQLRTELGWPSSWKKGYSKEKEEGDCEVHDYCWETELGRAQKRKKWGRRKEERDGPIQLGPRTGLILLLLFSINCLLWPNPILIQFALFFFKWVKFLQNK